MQTPFSPQLNTIPYRDRASAGRWLAKELESRAKQENVVVLGIPRGGALIAAEIASALHVPLDVFVVRKVLLDDGRNVGAIASGGVCVLRQDILKTSEVEAVEIADAVSEVRDQVIETERRYRQNRPAVNVQGRTVVLVDDGAASGGSLRAAVAALRPMAPAAIIVAIPVASAEASAHLAREAEELICPCVPDPFFSIGLAYERFPRISDDEVCARLGELDNKTYSLSQNDAGPYLDGARNSS